jgi:hypothetical protein
MRHSSTRKLFASVFASIVLAVGLGAPVASAQVAVQDGLVNVAIGDVEVSNNANVGVAAVVAANICGVKVGPVAVLGRAVDRSGDLATICQTPTGPVTIQQSQ